MKKKISTILTVLILLYPIGILWAFKERAIEFERITLEQGLSQAVINAITQDSKGFMWFGTQDGLNRYDGYTFTIYRHDSSDPDTLSDNHIRSLHTDKTGTLWVGTYHEGVDKFNRASETFIHYRHDPNDPNSISHNEISVIYEDRAGELWIGTQGGGINKFNRETDNFTHYKHIPGNPNSLGSNFIGAICEDSEGKLWIGTYGKGLNKFDRANQTFTRYIPEPGNPGGLNDLHITSISETRTGVLWIGTEGGGLNRWDREKDSFIHYTYQPGKPHGLCHNNVRFIYEDKKGMLWIGTYGGGLNIFDPVKETFTHYTHNSDKSDSLNHNRLLSIYEDSTAMLWIGTFGGINRFDPERLNFYHLKNNPNNPNSLNNNDIRAIYEDSSGVLWIGTISGGLNKFDRKKGTFTHYTYNPRNSNSIIDNRVFSILEDRTGLLWIGTPGGGICAFDRERETFTQYRHDPHDPGSLSNDRVRSIYEDSSGRLWIGTLGGGMDRFDPQKKIFIHYRHNPDNPYSLGSDRVFTIRDDKTGMLWIGTFGGGLDKFDSKEEIFTHHRHDPNNPNSLSSNRIFSIHVDRGGVLWIGTDGGGLNRFDRKEGKWTRFSEKEGLPNNVIYGILEDHKGNLWLSTNKGLSKHNPQTQGFNNYSIKDGLENIEFNSGAYYKNPITGEMFFGGINGVDSFFPDTIKANPHIYPVVITAFRKFNKKIKFKKSVEEMGAISLSYKTNFFSFEFVTPEFRNPYKTQYAYKLEGFDRKWIQCGTRRYANYTNISGGQYTFRVKSSNQDGAWSETSVRIRITPPFWQTWWFLVTMVGVVFALVFTFHQIRTYSIQRRNRQLEVINLQLNLEIAEREQAELLQATLYKIARIAHSDMDFGEIYHSIHQSIGQLIDAKNFYIALYDAKENSIFLPYFVDEFDDYQGHTIKASRGLTEYVIRTGKSILITDAECYELEEKGEIELLGERSQIWLGVPLKFKNEIFGAVVVQHYTSPQAYTEKDKKMLEFVSGQIASVIHSKREEEKKKDLVEKLHLSKKMEAIGRLAGGVAHDLNNVLSAIVSYPELLLMKLPKDSPMLKPLLTMKRSGLRAAAIVQDLLTLARRGVDTKEVVNWNDIIDEYLKSPIFKGLKTRHPKIEVEVELEKELLYIEGSPVHLTKALMNLCSNAAEAMPEGGKITLTTKNLYPEKTLEGCDIDNFVVVSISDTGVGIPQKDLKRIFEPFYTKKEMGLSGTGLGMTIVWNTINDHDGYINIGSIKGKGTTFELYFPVSPEAAFQGRKTIGIEEYLGNGERILVVDDVLEQREILTVLLNELGYSVKSVANGEDAVEYMRTHTNDVDLVVLDMIMDPGMDGLDTYEQILKIQPGIKAIIASGFSETERVKKTMKMGAGSYIQKPYTLEKIGSALKRELER